MLKTRITSSTTRATLLVLASLLSACAVTPRPLTPDEVGKRVASDRANLHAGQPPFSGPLSLAQATARAIHFNLDYRLRSLEIELAGQQLDLSKFDLLPRVLASGGYATRSNDLAYITDSGAVSASAVERARSLASIEFAWNALDFGAAYYRAKYLSDAYLVAQERRRKALQNLVYEVRGAYWKALAAQRLMPQLRQLEVRVRTALDRAREVERQGLLPLPQALSYQRALLDTVQSLERRRQELETAKLELANLVNAPSPDAFVLADGAASALPAVPDAGAELEAFASSNRPELREEDYAARMTESEARRVLTSMLPGISIGTSMQYDSNRFLANSTWNETSVRLSLDLLRLTAIPSANRVAAARRTTDEARRAAQTIAVTTQVRLAVARYAMAKREYDYALESEAVDARSVQYARSATGSGVEGELELVRSEARAVLSRYLTALYHSYASIAYARIVNSIGADLELPSRLGGLDDTVRFVEASFSDWLPRVDGSRSPSAR